MTQTLSSFWRLVETLRRVQSVEDTPSPAGGRWQAFLHRGEAKDLELDRACEFDLDMSLLIPTSPSMTREQACAVTPTAFNTPEDQKSMSDVLWRWTHGVDDQKRASAGRPAGAPNKTDRNLCRWFTTWKTRIA